MITKACRALQGVFLVTLLSACAAAVQTQPASFKPAPGGRFEIKRSTDIRLPTGYVRVLAAGSRWQRVGRLPEGTAYGPVGTSFTIEGRQVHEAYLVISPQRSLVGFYLPGESSISMLPAPIPLHYEEEPWTDD